MFNSLFLLVQNKFNNIQGKLVNNKKINNNNNNKNKKINNNNNNKNNINRMLNMNIPDITDPLQNKLLQNAIQHKTNPPRNNQSTFTFKMVPMVLVPAYGSYCYWMFFALPMSLWRHLSPRPLLTKGPQTRHQLPIPYTNEELYKEDSLH